MLAAQHDDDDVALISNATYFLTDLFDPWIRPTNSINSGQSEPGSNAI